jgi:hypothetical protein
MNYSLLCVMYRLLPMRCADLSFRGVLQFSCVCVCVCNFVWSRNLKRGRPKPKLSCSSREKQNKLERCSRGLISVNISTFTWRDGKTTQNCNQRTRYKDWYLNPGASSMKGSSTIAKSTCSVLYILYTTIT